MEENISNHIFEKVLISGIYIEFLQIINKEPQINSIKNWKITKIDISSKKILQMVNKYEKKMCNTTSSQGNKD